MFSNKTYKVLFLLIMCILCLPLCVQILHIPDIRPLKGYDQSEEKSVSFSPKNILNEDFQHYLDKKANSKFGCRSFFIRYYNQLVFSCFHKSTNDNIIIGKNKEMFMRQYTDDFSGKTLLKEYGSVDSAKLAARENIAKTLELIDSLKAHNTAFLVVLAPSKTIIYPEYLPDSIKDFNFSLQREYASLFQKFNIPFLDFVPIFSNLKKTSKYPLYTRSGTHWQYGLMPFVADTLLSEIGKHLNMQMPHTQVIDSNFTNHYYGADIELEETSNLLFPLRHPKMPVCKYQLSDIPKSYKKPKILVVADSYFTQLENSPFTDAFENVEYWKYNWQAISIHPERVGDVYAINRYNIIEEADIVVVMFTTMFAYNYMFGFANATLDMFYEGDTFDSGESYEKIIENIIIRIKGDPAWYKNVEKQAKQRHITVEESLRQNAEYVYEIDYGKR